MSDPYISTDHNQQEFAQIEEIIRESLKKEDWECYGVDWKVSHHLQIKWRFLEKNKQNYYNTPNILENEKNEL